MIHTKYNLGLEPSSAYLKYGLVSRKFWLSLNSVIKTNNMSCYFIICICPITRDCILETSPMTYKILEPQNPIYYTTRITYNLN